MIVVVVLVVVVFSPNSPKPSVYIDNNGMIKQKLAPYRLTPYYLT